MFKWQLLTTTRIRSPEGEGSGGSSSPEPAGNLAGGEGSGSEPNPNPNPSKTTNPTENDTPPGGAGDDTQTGGQGDDTTKGGAADDDSLATGKDDLPRDIEGKPLPEKYEIKAPDGFVVDEALNTKFQGVAKELRLSPAQAQKMADTYAEIQGEQARAWADTIQGWRDAAKEDKTIGGPNFNQNVAVVRRMVQDYGDDELKKVFNDYGVGNHPAMLRFIYRMGRNMAEGSVQPGGGNGNPGQGEVTAGDFYPSMSRK